VPFRRIGGKAAIQGQDGAVETVVLARPSGRGAEERRWQAAEELQMRCDRRV